MIVFNKINIPKKFNELADDIIKSAFTDVDHPLINEVKNSKERIVVHFVLGMNSYMVRLRDGEFFVSVSIMSHQIGEESKMDMYNSMLHEMVHVCQYATGLLYGTPNALTIFKVGNEFYSFKDEEIEFIQENHEFLGHLLPYETQASDIAHEKFPSYDFGYAETMELAENGSSFSNFVIAMDEENSELLNRMYYRIPKVIRYQRRVPRATALWVEDLNELYAGE